MAPLRNKSLKASAVINYKDILQMLFANISFTVADLRKGYMNAYGSENDKIIHQLIKQEKYYQVFQITQEFSKGFYKWNSKVSEMISLGRDRQNYLIRGKHYDGYTNFLVAQISGMAQPLKWLSVSSNNNVSFSQSYVTDQGKKDNYWMLQSSNNLLINLFDPVMLKAESEVYYNSYFSSDRVTHLFNTSLEWKLRRATLNLMCINLFNQTVYHRAIDSGVLLSVNDVALRGRTFLVGVRVKLF